MGEEKTGRLPKADALVVCGGEKEFFWILFFHLPCVGRSTQKLEDPAVRRG